MNCGNRTGNRREGGDSLARKKSPTVEVFIEIPKGSRNKYEFDKEKKVLKDWDKLSDAERKQGIMRGDSVLTGIRTQLVGKAVNRMNAFPVDMDALSDIGIKTSVDTSEGSTSSGTLVIDETKLDKALKENPDLVANLFFTDTDADGKWDYRAVQ
jgi:flagellar capping protein FliD